MGRPMGYEVYRDGRGSVRERIREAVRGYYARHRRLPVSVVVNPTEAEAAREALEALDLKVRVESSGGCLKPEVWLRVGDD